MDVDQDSMSPSPASPRGDGIHGSAAASPPVPETINAASSSPIEDSAAAHPQPVGSPASGHAAETMQSSGLVAAGTSKGRPVAPTDAHVVVIQPDNEVNVGVNVNKCVSCIVFEQRESVYTHQNLACLHM